jgi:hypothetical protein
LSEEHGKREGREGREGKSVGWRQLRRFSWKE